MGIFYGKGGIFGGVKDKIFVFIFFLFLLLLVIIEIDGFVVIFDVEYIFIGGDC